MDTDKRVAPLYHLFFYCSATHVTSQVLQPKTVNKRYKGQHTFSVSIIILIHNVCKPQAKADFFNLNLSICEFVKDEWKLTGLALFFFAVSVSKQ